MDYLSITNWERWQSWRSDRGQPPWIKLHRALLRNPEWCSLNDAQRGQLVSMWILAADKNGRIPADPYVLKRLCHMSSLPNLEVFKELGFINTGVNVASTWRQDDANMTPQNRGEESRGDKEVPLRRATSFCAELRNNSHAESEPEPFLEFPVTGDRKVKTWTLFESKVLEYEETYDTVDVRTELRHAKQWCVDHPKKRKTAGGMPRFLSSWLKRAANSKRPYKQDEPKKRGYDSGEFKF